MTQPKVALITDVSVGKVNYCLGALVDMGWVKANNFRLQREIAELRSAIADNRHNA